MGECGVGSGRKSSGGSSAAGPGCRLRMTVARASVPPMKPGWSVLMYECSQSTRLRIICSAGTAPSLMNSSTAVVMFLCTAAVRTPPRLMGCRAAMCPMTSAAVLHATHLVWTVSHKTVMQDQLCDTRVMLSHMKLVTVKHTLSLTDIHLIDNP